MKKAIVLAGFRFDVNDVFPEVEPRTIARNLSVPFLVAIMEEYFRATFVALATYNENRNKVFSGIRLTAAELVPFNSTVSMVEAIAQRLSFQDLKKVHSHFRALDDKVDILGWLRKPYRRRKETPFDALTRLIEHRHALVHRAEVESRYGKEEAWRDIDIMLRGVHRIYLNLSKQYSWSIDPRLESMTMGKSKLPIQ